MDLRDRLDRVVEWIEDAGWVFWVGLVAIIVAIAVPLWLLLPALQPKPAPTYPSLSSLTSTAQPDITGAAPIPQELHDQIMTMLKVKDPDRVSISWAGQNMKMINVAVATGPTEFKRYVFVEKDGVWEKQK